MHRLLLRARPTMQSLVRGVSAAPLTRRAGALGLRRPASLCSYVHRLLACAQQKPFAHSWLRSRSCSARSRRSVAAVARRGLATTAAHDAAQTPATPASATATPTAAPAPHVLPHATTGGAAASVDVGTAAAAAAAASSRRPPHVLDSLVKVYTTASSPNYILPWQNKPNREITGSGFAIGGRRLLTNAHVIADQKFVQVRKLGSSEKCAARVLAVGHECDLALLTVDDDAFWDGVGELTFGDVPNLQDEVSVIGYPIGGDNVSITRGVVSRIEPQQYAHGAYSLLAIQIDAAINSGNSGGPALQGDRVIGVAFQNLTDAENIGFIIPVPIIEHFLNDIARTGAYVGFCSLGVQCQQTENKYLQSYLRMRPALPAVPATAASTPTNGTNANGTDNAATAPVPAAGNTGVRTGVLVIRVQPAGPAAGKLLPGDVLLSVDGSPLHSDGTVHFRNRERIGFDYLIARKASGEAVALRVLRNGQTVDVSVPLAPFSPLVPVFQYDRAPSYYIWAGCVFTALTQPYLHEYGENWYNTAPRKLVHTAMHGIKQRADEQVVVLAQVLLDDVNVGYQSLADCVVKRVNGVAVANLQHLKTEIETAVKRYEEVSRRRAAAAAGGGSSAAAASADAADADADVGSIRIDLEDQWTMVLDVAASLKAHAPLLVRHRIPSDRSPDLK